jgi:hypothetical protein
MYVAVRRYDGVRPYAPECVEGWGSRKFGDRDYTS